MAISPSAGYKRTQFKIHNGNKIVLYTDGLIAIRNKYNHQYGVEKLKQSIFNNQHLKASEFANGLTANKIFQMI